LTEKKKKIEIKLVEEDLAKIRYEMAYMDNHFKGAQKLINKYIRRWRQRRFNVKVSLYILKTIFLSIIQLNIKFPIIALN